MRSCRTHPAYSHIGSSIQQAYEIHGYLSVLLHRRYFHRMLSARYSMQVLSDGQDALRSPSALFLWKAHP